MRKSCCTDQKKAFEITKTEYLFTSQMWYNWNNSNWKKKSLKKQNKKQLVCRKIQEQVRNGILLPKLFWPTVRKNCSSDREKLLKFDAESRGFAKFLRSRERFI